MSKIDKTRQCLHCGTPLRHVDICDPCCMKAARHAEEMMLDFRHQLRQKYGLVGGQTKDAQEETTK